MTHHHDHDHEHVHEVAKRDLPEGDLREEQAQLAREIGQDLTESFVGYVLGEISFEDTVFGVFNALSDLNVVQSGEYEIEDVDEDAGHEFVNADEDDEELQG